MENGTKVVNLILSTFPCYCLCINIFVIIFTVDSFPEFMQVLYWVRQMIGVTTAVFYGLFNITGAFGFALFAVLNILIPFGYYRHYANINIDDFGRNEILSEGFQASFGLFMLVWVIIFSLSGHSV